MQRRLVILCALLLPIAVCSAQQRTVPEEDATAWEVPPGDPVEHMTAGYAKILCSALFITGRDLATAADEDGFFVRLRRACLVYETSGPEGVAPSSYIAPRGHAHCPGFFPPGMLTLPRGADSVFFTPA